MMSNLVSVFSIHAARLPEDVCVQLPHGLLLGATNTSVKLTISKWSSMACLKAGQIGALAEDYVEGTLQLDGAMRDVMGAVTRLLPDNPVASDTGWWTDLLPFDKISSVGMFEHVGHANMNAYFAKIMTLLVPGGLVMNHGITAGGLDNRQLGAGMGDFIEKYIFPGGELLHVSAMLEHMVRGGLELVDAENLRPHYARTLWAWSNALESRLDEARRVLSADGGPQAAEKTLRAYRVYLAGSAMSFEQGWLSLHQLLATRPLADGSRPSYPFTRDHMYGHP